MGCDIHLYLEYSKKEKVITPEKTRWDYFGGRINPGRNYLMFGIMSRGVRTEPIFSIARKELPDDCGYASQDDSRIFISETPNNNYVTMEKALQWEKRGCKLIPGANGKIAWVEHPDWHSHSWLNTAEFKKVMDFYNKETKGQRLELEYEVILAVMKKFEKLGFNARIVFWFDN